MKIGQRLLDIKNGSPWFPAKNHSPQTFQSPVYMEPNWKIVSRPKLQTKVILLGTLGTNSLNSQVLQIKGTPLGLNIT